MTHKFGEPNDQGGDGDCLLRTLSFSLTKLLGLSVTKEELFLILKKYYPDVEEKTWLNDKHLSFFSTIFPICICVDLEINNKKEKKSKKLHFGDPTFPQIQIKNIDNQHFLPFEIEFNQDTADLFWSLFLMDVKTIDNDGYAFIGLSKNLGISQTIEMLKEFDTEEKPVKQIVIRRMSSHEHTVEMLFHDNDVESVLSEVSVGSVEEDQLYCEFNNLDWSLIEEYNQALHKDLLDLMKPECKTEYLKLRTLKYGDFQGGSCIKLKDDDNFLDVSKIYPYCCDQIYDTDNFECLVKNFKMLMSSLVNNQNRFFNDEVEKSGHYVKSIKDFFKFRHDILMICFLLSFKNDEGVKLGSDVPLSKYIDSRKTPDFILELEEEKMLFLIENSVTADMNKSAYQKGLTIETSIYKNEIVLLKEAGYEVRWVPLFYDTSSRTNNWNLAFDQFKENNVNFDKDFSNNCLSYLESEVPDFRVLDRMNYLNFLETDFQFGGTINNTACQFIETSIKNNIIEVGDATNTVTVAVFKPANYCYQKNRTNMLEQLPALKNKKYSLLLRGRGFSFVPNDDGFTPLRWYGWIENDQLVTIFRHSKFRGPKNDHHIVNYGDTVVVHQEWTGKKIENYEQHDHAVFFDIEIDDIASYENSYHFKPCYEKNNDWKIDFDQQPEGTSNLLSDCLVTDDVVKDSVVQLRLDLMEKQKEVIDRRPRNPFTMPFVDPNKLFDKDEGDYTINVDFLEGDLRFDILTTKIVDLIREKKFKKTYLISEKDSQSYQDARIEYVKNVKKLENGKLPKLRDMLNSEDLNLKQKAQDYLNESKRFGEMVRKSKASADNSMVKPFSLNQLRDNIKDQDIFSWRDKSKRSTMRGISPDLLNQSLSFCEKSLSFLQMKSDRLPREDEILNHGYDSPEMLRLKEVMSDRHKYYKDFYRTLNVSEMSEFVSRYYYTILYFSQKKCNSDSFLCSNLGYKNSLLMVRGGKKVWQTQKSRPFCAIFPVPDYFTEHKDIFSPSTHFFDSKGQTYLYTGWSTCNEKVLEDKSFFSYKSCSLVVNYLVRSENLNASYDENLNNIMFNVLLAFNNRRSTESYLSSIRNLLANSMGVYSSIKELVNEFKMIPQDSVQAFLSNKLSFNYYDFYKQVNESVKNDFNDGTLKHLFTQRPIVGVNDLTNLLYCTYAMTRAPYEQALEQSLNLKKMMDTHEKYVNTINKDKHLEFYEATNKQGWSVFDNEFYCDYKYSVELGRRCSDILKAYDRISEVHSFWHNTMNRPWTEITTSSGMRKNELKKEKGFFGKKGHEVVMEELLRVLEDKDMFEEFEKIKKLTDEDMSFQKQVQKINSMNISIKDKIVQVIDKLHFVFHVVDKTQWKGMREIFVMTMNTKLMVWPMEQFFKKLCQFIDNEIISIPSNKRLSVIHSRLFEQKIDKNSIKVFLTLDCKRWGPMCVFLKYAYFILGMADTLPKSMVDMFLFITILYFKKEIVVSPRAWKVFSSNKSNEQFIKHFDLVKDLDTAKFKMPYSFIMGIFNYLSSLMHAINQVDACEKACEMVRIQTGEDIAFNMDAHSDDSGGIIVMKNNHNKDKVLKIAVKVYEYNLRRVNHMLSTKKCVISYKYFELLSILYVNNRLLPLVPKFFSNLEFKPTLQGYASDMAQSYSKCIELLSIGATLSEAYFNMRLYSEMVRRAYHIKLRSDKPINAYGSVHAHPLLVLLLGSMADNCRLYHIDKNTFLMYQSAVKFLGGNEHETFQQAGFKNHQKLLYRDALKKLKAKIEEVYSKETLEMEIFKKVDFKNTLLRPLSFYHKLGEASFVNSLNYTTNTRRLTRLFYDQSMPNIVTAYGSFNNHEINELVDLLVSNRVGTSLSKAVIEKFNDFEKLQIDHKQENVFDFLFGEAKHLYNYLSVSIADNVKVQKISVTCKPCQFSMDLSKINLKISDSMESIYYSDQPEMFRWFGKAKDLSRDKASCLQVLNSLDIYPKEYDDFIYYLRKLEKYKCELYAYGYVETNNRIITNYEDMIKYLETNSIYGYKITKIFENVKLKYHVNDVSKILNPTIKQELNLVKLYTLIDSKVSRKRKNILSYELPEKTVSHFEVESNIKAKINNDMLNDYLLFKRNINKNLNFLNLNYFFVWLKRSKRIGDHWLGSSEVFVMLNKTPIVLVIERGYLTLIHCDEYKQISSYDINLLELLLTNWGVKLINNMPQWSVDMVLGMKQDKMVIDHEKNVDLLIAPIMMITKDYIPLFNKKKYKHTEDPSIYFSTDGSYSIKLLLSEFRIDTTTCKEISKNMTKEDFAAIGFRFLEPVNLVDIDKIDIIENLPRTSIYSNLIFGKLGKGKQMIEHLKNLQSYTMLTQHVLKDLIELNLDPDLIPDDIWKSVSLLKLEEMRENNFNMLLNDLRKCMDDDNWSDFFNTWGGFGDQNQLVVFNDTMLMDILTNPASFCNVYPELSLNAANHIYEFFDTQIDEKFIRLLTAESSGYFFEERKISRTEFMQIIIRLFHTSQTLDKVPDLGSQIMKYIFNKLFNTSYMFKKFKAFMSKGDLTKTLPIKPDLDLQWASLFINCSEVKPKHYNRFFNYEQVRKNFYTRAKGEEALEYNYDTGALRRYTHISTRELIKKEGSGDMYYRFSFKESMFEQSEMKYYSMCFEPDVKDLKVNEDDFDDCDEMEDFFYNQRMNFQDSRSQLEEDKEEVGDVIDKLIPKYNLRNKIIDLGNIKTSNIDKYKGTEKHLPGKELIIPLLDLVGYFCLDWLATVYGHFCVRLDTVPADLHLQPSDRIQLAKDPYNKGFNNTILIFYNIPFDIKKLGFNQLTKKDTLRYGKTHLNPRFYYSVSGEDFYLDDSYESIYFNQKMITKFKKTKDEIDENEQSANKMQDKMFAYNSFLKSLLSWDYEEDEDKKIDDLNSAIFKVMRLAQESFKLNNGVIKVDGEMIRKLQNLYDINGYDLNLSIMMEQAPHLSEVAVEFISQKHMKTFSLAFMVKKGVELSSKNIATFLSKQEETNKGKMDYKKETYKLRFNEEFDKYNPLEKDPALSAELKGIFQDDFELFANRRLTLTAFHKIKLMHLYKSLRATIKGSSMVIENIKKYDLFLRFICELINNSDEATPNTKSISNRFFNRLNFIYDDLLNKTLEHVSGEEDDEPDYLAREGVDYVEERRYFR
jgi:hypothetical protein